MFDNFYDKICNFFEIILRASVNIFEGIVGIIFFIILCIICSIFHLIEHTFNFCRGKGWTGTPLL